MKRACDENHDDISQDSRLRRVLDALPGPVRRAYAWLARPQAKWVRLPVGCLLIAGGLLGFLPLLGFWMIPVGAILIGQDIPPVRRVTLHGLGKLQTWWDRRRGP